MVSKDGPSISWGVAYDRFMESRIIGGETDSVTKAMIPVAGGLEPETLPALYIRLPEHMRVLSDSVLAELGGLLVEQQASLPELDP